jgi:ApbE superfamily uncharacterized protein (UPF0280 family)
VYKARMIETSMGKKLITERRVFKESNILFQSDSVEAIDAAITSITANRSALERYILTHPPFLHSLRPVPIASTAPHVVKLMAASTHALNIGPMAAVAGALADLALDAMRAAKAKIAIIENGGEVAAQSDRAFTVGLYAGKTAVGGTTGFQIEPSECPIGVGTSSATVGHAFSFGEADAATVFAASATLADAGATAVCNMVQGKDVEASIQRGLRFAETIDFVRGVLIVRGDCVGVVGRVPTLVRIENDLGTSVSFDATTAERTRDG